MSGTGANGQVEILSATIPTARLDTCVRFVADRESRPPVVLLHGNTSSSPFFFPLMESMPRRFRPLAIDLRGFGGTAALPVDATRGLRDFSDDVLAALDALDIAAAHIVGWSLGGGVAMRLAIDAPERVESMTLIAPISPFGFGGTVDAAGTLLAPDGAGSGAGLVSRRFVQSLADGDAGEGKSSPRTLLRNMYVGPDWDRENEETYVAAMLSTVVGDDNYPGDVVSSPHWPGVAPGGRGVLNAMSPVNLALTTFVDTTPKSRVLWLRGSEDHVVSDHSSMDLAQRGLNGSIPDYPGVEFAPPQPMVTQTRAVLDSFAAAGGSYREVVIPGVGHAPHIEDVAMVLETLVPHLDGAERDD